MEDGIGRCGGGGWWDKRGVGVGCEKVGWGKGLVDGRVVVHVGKGFNLKG